MFIADRGSSLSSHFFRQTVNLPLVHAIFKLVDCLFPTFYCFSHILWGKHRIKILCSTISHTLQRKPALNLNTLHYHHYRKAHESKLTKSVRSPVLSIPDTIFMLLTSVVMYSKIYLFSEFPPFPFSEPSFYLLQLKLKGTEAVSCKHIFPKEGWILA